MPEIIPFREHKELTTHEWTSEPTFTVIRLWEEHILTGGLCVVDDVADIANDPIKPHNLESHYCFFPFI